MSTYYAITEQQALLSSVSFFHTISASFVTKLFFLQFQKVQYRIQTQEHNDI